MNRAGLYIGTVLALCLAVAGWMYTSPAEEETGATSSGGDDRTFQAPSGTTTPVTAAEAVRDTLVMRITATGIAEAEQVLNVAAEVDGTIEEIPVKVGEKVAPGDLLVRLDDSDRRLEVARAEEQLLTAVMSFAADQLDIGGEQAVEQLDEGEMSARAFLQQMISEQGYRTIQGQPELEERLESISREDLFRAQAQLTAQRVAVQRAELDLARTSINAPFEGRLAGLATAVGPNSRRWPVVGQQVGAGTELVMLVDDDPIKLRIEVLESEASLVHQGRQAEVTFHAYPGETFTGAVEAISPLVDSERRSLSVTVSLPNPDGRIKPGMAASVVLETEIFEDRLLVPASAVLVRNERPLVFVIRDGRSDWKYVTEGLKNDRWVEILEGVSEGDLVVTGGHFALAHDVAVNVVEELGPQPGADAAPGGPTGS